MLAHGSDRVRVLGEKIILLSPVPKGWKPRVPRTNIHSEHPGTAVLWEEKYFEVVSAEATAGGVRYVLMPWPDEHVFRVFEQYDAGSEARRIEDYKAALKQQKGSIAARLLSVFLGHLPAPVQNRLANEYGIAADRMTLISIIPSIVLLGACVWIYVGARMEMRGSPVPGWLWAIALFMIADSGLRFMVVMLQSRAQGSFPGTVIYFILWKMAPERFPSPVAERGRGVFMLDPDEELALRDAIEVRAPLFTFLRPDEQLRLKERFGFDYGQHARGPAIVILVFALLGALTAYVEFSKSGTITALLSLVIAGALAIEQIARLIAFRRRPAGSVLGMLVRPFVRDFLA